jgi:hypothetical protein
MIEHLVIVPTEIRLRPKRYDYWVQIVDRELKRLETGGFPDNADRDFCALYSWVFNTHVLADDNLSRRIRASQKLLGLEQRADAYQAAMIPALVSKDAAVRVCAEHFDLRRQYICLDYHHPRTRTRRHVEVFPG